MEEVKNKSSDDLLTEEGLIALANKKLLNHEDAHTLWWGKTLTIDGVTFKKKGKDRITEKYEDKDDTDRRGNSWKVFYKEVDIIVDERYLMTFSYCERGYSLDDMVDEFGMTFEKSIPLKKKVNTR